MVRLPFARTPSNIRQIVAHSERRDYGKSTAFEKPLAFCFRTTTSDHDVATSVAHSTSRACLKICLLLRARLPVQPAACTQVPVRTISLATSRVPLRITLPVEHLSPVP